MTQQQYQPSPDRAQNLQGRSSSLHPSAVNASTSASYSGYLSFPQCRVVKFRPDRKCVLQWDSGQQTVVQISRALVLIGALPNLSFLRDNGRPLGLSPKEAITCRRNPIDVDPYTNSVLAAEGPGMYAMGPLVGENFVRFLKGGALAIASHLNRKRREARGGGPPVSDQRLLDATQELCLQGSERGPRAR